MGSSSMNNAVDRDEKDSSDDAHAADRQLLIAAGRFRAGRWYVTNAETLGAAEGFV